VLSGQLNLLEAAITISVKRFFPSDYSVEYFKLGGDNYNLDLQLKLRTNAVLAQEHVNRQTNMVILRSTITYLRSFCTAAMLLTFPVIFLKEKSYLNFVFWSHHAFIIYSQ
jgi:hypothetical protein